MAAATTPIWTRGETFYVPHFQVMVGNQQLDPMVVRDIMQVTFHDQPDSLNTVDITLNNWDAAAMKPKYEPSSNSKYEGLFDPGKNIQVSMGYAGSARNDRVMLSGEITSLTPVFPESGPLTLTVGAQSSLARFKKKQHTWSWTAKDKNAPTPDGWRDTEIAKEICRNPVTDQKPGLDMLFEGNPDYLNFEKPRPLVQMKAQFDILFLMEMAREHGYCFLFDIENGKDKLIFRPPDQITQVTYELAWGTSLIDFRPSLSTAQQVGKVTVHGWDRKAGKNITATSLFQDLSINKDLHKIADLIEGREEVIMHKPVSSQGEAQDLAKNLHRDQLYHMLKASGTTVGLPDLRAGRKVEIKNLGPNFSGTYFVEQTTHTINDSGYRTSFNAHREDGLKKTAPGGNS